MAELIDCNEMDHIQDPPGHMPSLAQREPEETDLDADSFRSYQFTVRDTCSFPSVVIKSRTNMPNATLSHLSPKGASIYDVRTEGGRGS